MKQIRIITVALILAIIVSAVSAITVINGKTVDAIGDVEMKDNSTDSVSIEWEALDDVDGYKVYAEDKDGNFTLAQKITDGETCSYKFEELEAGIQLKVKVAGYKVFNKKEYDGEESAPICVYTTPEKMVLKAYSGDKGVLKFKWTEKKAQGYELEYSKNENFEKKKTEDLKNDKISYKVKKLNPGDNYYSRIRSYIIVDSNKIYGEWSESCKTEIKDAAVLGADIDPNKPIVALSFDDGPSYPDGNGNSATNDILNVLEKYGARATFFMCGSRIASTNKNYLKRELELGCEIGNHTYDHSNYGKKVTATDISKSTKAIKNACGQAPTIFRCPGGMMSNTIQKECEKEGMPIAYWSVDTEDWKSKNPKKICSTATKYVYDGSIILMHDIYPTTAEAVKKLVPKLIKEGYQIVTVSEMLAVKNGGKAPKAGQQYIDYKTINNNT